VISSLEPEEICTKMLRNWRDDLVKLEASPEKRSTTTTKRREKEKNERRKK